MNQYHAVTDEELIKRLRNGESQIMDYIMEKYKNMVRKNANEMFLLGGENDDLIQEGMIGLFKAVMDFDFDKGVSFQHFAQTCVSRQLYTAIKASQRQKHIPLNSYVSLYEQAESIDEASQPPLIDTIQSERENNPEELFLNKEYLEGIEVELKSKLSELENRVLYLHLLGMDYRTIAQILDKSPKTIDNALQRMKLKVSQIVG